MNASSNFKRITYGLSFALLLLIAIPIIVWIIEWEWQSNIIYQPWDLLLYILTESGSAPIFGAITSFVFAVILSILCRKRYHWLFIFGAIFLLHFSTQVIKTGLKQIYKEPRPYMSHMIEIGIDPIEFYDNKRAIRRIMIKNHLDALPTKNIPAWLQHHWENETGYSFPSGHTIFATCWLFLFIGFLINQPTIANRFAFTIVTLWALLMLVSRLRLGMHYPIDLFVSTIFAYLLNLGFFYWLSKQTTLTIASIDLIHSNTTEQ